MAKKPKDSIEINMDDVKEKVNELLATISDPAPLTYTLKDMYNRAPGKVIDAVRSVYNIKKSDFKFKKYTEERRGFHYKRDFAKNAGGVKSQGNIISEFRLEIEGEPLTPTHFGMTPKERPEKKKYKVSAKIKKGKKWVFTPENEGGGVFLGALPQNKSKITAWERYSPARSDVRPIKTMSLPQMVGPSEDGQGGNPIVMNQINKDLEELLLKRLNHHLQRHLDKVGK